eukprot:INCI9564.1.p1 GENE.INCI9564.1~~INCI9564.1.p1  ORF type:complete len:429 (+),score=74.56 INCI9564.1:184-1470(+)
MSIHMTSLNKREYEVEVGDGLGQSAEEQHLVEKNEKKASSNSHAACQVSRLQGLAVGLAVLVLVVIIVAVATATATQVAPDADCDVKASCTQFADNYTVLQDMPTEAPSFLVFAQGVEEHQACVAPRAFLVGGVGREGWVQEWEISTTGSNVGSVVSRQYLVSADSSRLNWPHAIAQDVCSATLSVANANDNEVAAIPCSDQEEETSTGECFSFGQILNFSSAFYNPIGLLPFSSISAAGTGACTATAPETFLQFFVTGGVAPNNSYVAKYMYDGTWRYLVPPSAGLLNKPYSPAMLNNGSLLIADAFNDRVARIDCFDSGGVFTACAAANAESGSVSTLLETFYPRGVEISARDDGSEIVFIIGGSEDTLTTYLKRMDLADGEVSTLIHGGIMNNPHSVTVNPQTLDVVICDKGNNRVVALECLDSR